jgi:L-ribulose-5-phosphate 3-epimerase
MFKAINQWFFGGLPLADAFKQAKAAGFEGFEVCVGGEGEQLAWTDGQAKCKEVAAAARDAGIQISSVATGLYWGTSLSSPDRAERDKALDMTNAMLQQTAWLGAKHLLVVPANVGADFTSIQPVPYDIAYKLSLASLKKAVKTAEKLKVFMCVENVWNKFLYSPLEFKTFVKAIDSKFAAVYYDPANTILVGYPEHWIGILGSMIKRVHVKDFDRSKPTFPAGFDLAFGTGSVNWKAVMAALTDAGYEGPLTAEYIPPHPPYDGDTAAASKRVFADVSKTLGV